MAAIEEMNKSSLVTSLRRARGQISKARETGKVVVQKTVATTLTVGTAYGVGYVHANHPEMRKLGGSDVDTSLALGAVGLVVGVTGMLGEQSEHALSVGTGALAGFATLKGAGAI